jgi:hypothetical protein
MTQNKMAEPVLEGVNKGGKAVNKQKKDPGMKQGTCSPDRNKIYYTRRWQSNSFSLTLLKHIF